MLSKRNNMGQQESFWYPDRVGEQAKTLIEQTIARCYSEG